MKRYVFQGMTRDVALEICGVSKHQYYYSSNGKKQGAKPSQTTKRTRKDEILEVGNDIVVKQIQAYFEENHLNQIFTHPYTPQENGHIESFHAILSQKLKQYKFWSIQELEQVIILFYDKYNNKRLHSSICDLLPNIFIECWNK